MMADMSTLKMTPEEELLLKQLLTLNDKGERVFAGLTLEESIWHLEMGRAFAKKGKQAFQTADDKARYWQQHERNHQAAMEIADAARVLRVDKPAIN